MVEKTSKDAFTQAAIGGELALTMTPEARRELAKSCISQLHRLSSDSSDYGERTLSTVLQPLFALSGYRLRAEPVNKASVRFDFVAENLFGGDDRILVEYKFNRDEKPRSMVPDKIIKWVEKLQPEDPSRVVIISNTGFSSKAARQIGNLVGPRLELWSFDDIRIRLNSFVGDDVERTDALARIVADFLDKLAIGVAEAQLELARIEWRDMERLVAHVLKELGYAVALTQSSHDGGRDVVVADLHVDGIGIFNIEVKHWIAKKVGPREVMRFLEVSLCEKRDGALILGTSGFTPAAVSARGELHTDYLRLGNRDTIAMTCRTFARKRDGLWVAPRPFTSLMHDLTL